MADKQDTNEPTDTPTKEEEVEPAEVEQEETPQSEEESTEEEEKEEEALTEEDADANAGDEEGSSFAASEDSFDAEPTPEQKVSAATALDEAYSTLHIAVEVEDGVHFVGDSTRRATDEEMVAISEAALRNAKEQCGVSLEALKDNESLLGFLESAKDGLAITDSALNKATTLATSALEYYGKFLPKLELELIAKRAFVEKAIASGADKSGSYEFSANSRFFSIGGVHLSKMSELVAALENHRVLHEFTVKHCTVYSREFIAAVQKFFSETTSKEFAEKIDSLKSTIAGLHQQYYSAALSLVSVSANPQFKTTVPLKTQQTHEGMKGVSCLALLDNHYFMVMEPRPIKQSTATMKATSIRYYGAAIERDTHALKTNHQSISFDNYSELLAAIDKCLSIVKTLKAYSDFSTLVKGKVGTLVTLLKGRLAYEKRSGIAPDYTAEQLSRFIVAHTANTVYHPNIASLLLGARVVKEVSNIIQTIFDQEIDVKTSTPALEQVSETAQDKTFDTNAILAEHNEMLRDANDLSNAAVALESLLVNLRSAQQFGTHREKMGTLIGARATLSSVQRSTGITGHTVPALESNNEEGMAHALEGLIGTVVSTIKQVFTAIAGAVRNFFAKIEENNLQQKARAGGLAARLTIVSRSKALLEANKSLTFADNAFVERQGILKEWGSMVGAAKALTAYGDNSYAYYGKEFDDTQHAIYDAVYDGLDKKAIDAMLADMQRFAKLFFSESKQTPAASPTRIGKDQKCGFSPALPAGSQMRLISPDDIMSKVYSSNRFDELRITEVGSARKDILIKMPIANARDLDAAQEYFSSLVAKAEKTSERLKEVGSYIEFSLNAAEVAYHSHRSGHNASLEFAHTVRDYFTIYLTVVLTAHQMRAAAEIKFLLNYIEYAERSVAQAQAAQASEAIAA